MKLLCIGNSFSYDACTYMARIAEAGNFNLTTYNLFIGGCSLERHVSNMGKCDGEHLYEMNINGIGEMTKISLDEALSREEYDLISLQQASHFSGVWESYVPYIEKLAEHVRSYQPRAKIIIHETWAYEYNSEHDGFATYGRRQDLMHTMLTDCYHRAKELIGADMLIPSGELIAALRQNAEFDPERGGIPLTRDGFHMSLDYGRYAIGALWCAVLGMNNLAENKFLPEGENIDAGRLSLIKKKIEELVKA